MRTTTVVYADPPGYAVDYDLLQSFENGLNPQYPEANEVPGRVLGYGEISTVFEIQVPSLAGLVFKRMSLFETTAELDTYLTAYGRYHRLLEEIGLQLPPNGYASLLNRQGRPIFYIIQEKVPAGGMGQQALHLLSPGEARALFAQILDELSKVWAFNRRQESYQVAIDGQLSNWAIVAFDPERPPFGRESSLLYIDTSTPLFRINGVEQLNPELFLRAAPSFLRWVLRALFLQDVMNRYYELRRVIIDLFANLYKEQLAQFVPALLPAANEFLAEHDEEDTPISEKEVRDYYRQDRRIWTVYLAMRRLDRRLQNDLLGRQYPYILPGKIRR
jgi:hypothetical protein